MEHLPNKSSNPFAAADRRGAKARSIQRRINGGQNGARGIGRISTVDEEISSRNKRRLEKKGSK